MSRQRYFRPQVRGKWHQFTLADTEDVSLDGLYDKLSCHSAGWYIACAPLLPEFALRRGIGAVFYRRQLALAALVLRYRDFAPDFGASRFWRPND